MSTHRAILGAGLALVLGLAGPGIAAALGTIPAGDETGTPWIETSEVRDAAGGRFRIETRTDAFGWRTRTVRALDRGSDPSEPLDAVAKSARGSSAAAPGGWRAIGPEGGDVRTLAVSPRNPRLVLAGLSFTNGSGLSPRPVIYRSTDGGHEWSPVLSPPVSFYPLPDVRRLAFAGGGVVYAAIGTGLWRSHDDGETWQQVPDPAHTAGVTTVGVEPWNPRNVWVGYPDGTLSHSTDDGATWQSVTVPGAIQPAECATIAFDPNHPGRMGVGFADRNGGRGQVWMSADDGVTWTNGSHGLPISPVNVLAHDGARWLAGCGGFIQAHQGGIFASSDDGQHWDPLAVSWTSSQLPRIVRDLSFDPAAPCTLWVATQYGLHRTTDCGNHWTFSAGGAHENAFAVLVLPDGGGVLEGSESYADRKLAGTPSFVPSSHGIRSLDVGAVAVNPLDPMEIAAGFQGDNEGGVYTTRDGGGSWTLEPTLRARILDVAFDHEGLLYALTDGPTTINPGGLYRRGSNGLWTHLGPTLGTRYQTSLRWVRVSPHDSRLILCGGGDYTNGGFASSIWRSTDAGSHWTTVVRVDATTYFNPDGALLDDGTDQVWMATTASIPGVPVLRSEDRGATWAPSFDGLAPDARPWTIAPAPGQPDRVYVTGIGLNKMGRSDDGGRTWHVLPTNGPLDGLIVDPHDPDVLYGLRSAGIPNGTVVRSRDGGATFEAFTSGMEPVPFTSRLASDSGECPDLLAAGSAGVFARATDTVPPALDARPAPASLWPPDRRMVDVHVTLSLHDACDPAPRFELVSIGCNEPLEPGDVEGADFGTPDADFALRATRAGGGTGRTYTVTYRATDADGNSSETSFEIRVPHDQAGSRPGEAASGVARGLPAVTALGAVAPSPFARSTMVSFDLAVAGPVRLCVFDVRGSVVRTLADGFRPAGRFRIAWNGRSDSGDALPNGVYWVRFEASGPPQVRSLVLLR